MTDQKKTDREITTVKNEDGTESKVIRFKAETGNMQFRITPKGK